ncbi:MAG: triose-phosphate isomerase [Pseudomonadota bacterium]
MRLPTLLVGNWKMNLTPSESASYARSLRAGISSQTRTKVWVAPTTISLAHVVNELNGSAIAVGAQNTHWANSGAFTGETSPSAAKELGLAFTILGHSERRTYFGESSEAVATRMKAALAAGLIPIVCVGETEQQRARGETNAVIEAQLAPIFAELNNESSKQVIVAYEPVWAIGTGKVASLAEIEETHTAIHAMWSKQGYPTQATVLYGGSVTPQNFAGIGALAVVSGALVGGASLKIDQWLELIAIAEAL